MQMDKQWLEQEEKQLVRCTTKHTHTCTQWRNTVFLLLDSKGS